MWYLLNWIIIFVLMYKQYTVYTIIYIKQYTFVESHHNINNDYLTSVIKIDIYLPNTIQCLFFSYNIIDTSVFIWLFQWHIFWPVWWKLNGYFEVIKIIRSVGNSVDRFAKEDAHLISLSRIPPLSMSDYTPCMLSCCAVLFCSVLLCSVLQEKSLTPKRTWMDLWESTIESGKDSRRHVLGM